MPGPARADSWWSRERDLFSLLLKFGASEATDMRDMVFALLGISNEPANHQLLRADYKKSLQEVLHDTVRYWFQSSTIPVDQDQVLCFLAGFKTIHATYLVPPEKAWSERKRFQSSLTLGRSTGAAEYTSDIDWETVECVTDAELLLLEQHSEKAGDSMNTCYAELDKMQSNLHVNRASHILQIMSGRKQKIKYLIVKDAIEALILVCKYEFQRVFDLIVNKCTNDKQALLNSALLAALGKTCSSINGAEDASAQGNFIDDGIFFIDGIKIPSDCGHQKIVQMLLDEGADVNAQGGYYGSALQAASVDGHKEIVQILLDRGADANAQGGYFGNALQTASGRGYKKIVSRLLNRGAHVNTQGGLYGNALQAASGHGPVTIVEMLLDNGADVNAQGGYYGNALQAAAVNGRRKVVRILLDEGAYVDAQGGAFDNAVQGASFCGHNKIEQMLLRASRRPSKHCEREILDPPPCKRQRREPQAA